MYGSSIWIIGIVWRTTIAVEAHLPGSTCTCSTAGENLKIINHHSFPRQLYTATQGQKRKSRRGERASGSPLQHCLVYACMHPFIAVSRKMDAGSWAAPRRAWTSVDEPRTSPTFDRKRCPHKVVRYVFLFACGAFCFPL